MKLSDMKLFLLDMDGTIYLGDRLFPETPGFLKSIKDHGGHYVFLTNNSSKDKGAYVDKLNRLGIQAGLDDIFSSGDATSLWLKKQKKNAKLYVVGNQALQNFFQAEGFVLTSENPDFLILGFDTELTYEKLHTAHDLILSGTPWVCTHPDLVCPLDGGKTMPDTGSMIALLEASTGKKPDFIIGKPNKIIVESALDLYGGQKESTVMVGDRLYTDIAVGASAGIAVALVLSGETSLENYQSQNTYHADFVYQNVGEMAQILEDRL